jgi:hypothetical protein
VTGSENYVDEQSKKENGPDRQRLCRHTTAVGRDGEWRSLEDQGGHIHCL